jgi:hypothetical protein
MGQMGWFVKPSPWGLQWDQMGHYGDLEWLWFGKDPINGSIWVTKCSSGLLHITTWLKGNLVRIRKGKVSNMVRMYVASGLILSCIKFIW